MGGGTSDQPAPGPVARGLSPRGRGNPHPPRLPELWHRSIPAWAGNHLLHESFFGGLGSIPAWAGEPRQWDSRRRGRGVYPRVGGGTYPVVRVPSKSSGLSPRGRGNPSWMQTTDALIRSIPAWAGEPFNRPLTVQTGSVYPRVGGGTVPIPTSTRPPCGLSPRGRGNRGRTRGRGIYRRSIPAWAGEPVHWKPWRSLTAVYPRVGGGTDTSYNLRARYKGLSPSGRGNRFMSQAEGERCRSIPAWAGEPTVSPCTSALVTVYPRVGGGTHRRGQLSHMREGLSPRGRGNHVPLGYLKVLRGSIPAWAGEPPPAAPCAGPAPVYPRVGGGTGSNISAISAISGLSPRGRGNPVSST